jgi:hypothetical protein
MATKSPSESTDLVVIEAEGASLPLLASEQEVLRLTAEFAAAWRHTLDMAVSLGLALVDLKEDLPHGQFLPWLDAHFPLGKRMAQNFMNLADPSKAQEIALLPPNTTVTAAVKYLEAKARTPRPLPAQDGVGLILDDAEATRTPLLRFARPDTPTHVLVTQMLLTFFPDAADVLDSTYGSGNFWGPRSHVKVTAHDLDLQRAPDGVMDATMLNYDDASFDVVVFDPPHLADGGEDSEMAGRFGTVQGQAELDELILAGTREAWRVCSKGIIVKVTNHVHAQVFQEESTVVAEAMNWTIPYDTVYQVRSHAFIDPSWGTQCSAYNNGAVYLVYRKGDQRHIVRGREG